MLVSWFELGDSSRVERKDLVHGAQRHECLWQSAAAAAAVGTMDMLERDQVRYLDVRTVSLLVVDDLKTPREVIWLTIAAMDGWPS